ncbi:MAG: family 43 glycosylhydrolase [Candidatus Ornithomonoglobus sp.]
MKFKRIISLLISSATLSASGFAAVPASADGNGDCTAYLSDELMDEEGGDDMTDGLFDSPLESLTLPYTAHGYKIAGNITLPQEIDGQAITWTSSMPDVINTEAEEFSAEDKERYGENYTEIPAGVVTRQAEDVQVTLTASVAGNGQEYTKQFVVTVKAAPEKSYAEMDEDGDFKGYLYASFIEPPKDANGQQVYFASSDDGRNWTDLNSNRPVLTSTLGTGSTRDHYIIRTPEGDRFYLIATDLNCFESGKTWDDYAKRGSKYIMVWETDDLVNWSEQRMVKIADDYTGCAWAPETIYDELTGEYIVYWSGHDINQESESYSKKVVYYSKTRDFYSFTPQQRYVLPTATDGVDEGTSKSFIDTTMIKGSDGRFYRVTKYEEVSPTRVFMDVADYPLGKFERVRTNLSDNTFLGTEGPGWFKYNKDDAENFGAKYCLMLDGYNEPNKNIGFFPTTVADLNGGGDFTFTRITSNFKMRTNSKHGGIVPLTQEEYDRVNEAYIKAEKADLSPYTSEVDKSFDISDSYPEYPPTWTLPDDKSLDNNDYHYLGINGKSVMGDGYGVGSEWVTVQFDMAANSGGDNIIRDIDGKGIIGYCYAPGSDGLWVGHGERSYGGSVKDTYGVKRLSNYLKTESGDRSDRDNVGHSIYAQHDICTIIMENAEGTVDNYTGDYYTVKTYINEELLSTEYYSGNFNGIGSIEVKAKQYFGQLRIYTASKQKPEIDTSNKHLLFAVDFNDETTTAKKGIATAYGINEYTTGNDGSKAAVFDGSSSYISAARSDGTPLLRGTDKAVINMNVKMEQPTTTNGWYFYTSWSDGAQNNSRRSYTGIFCRGTNGNTVAERYRDNSGTPTITADTSFNSWHEVTYIIDGYTAELYIDGCFAGSKDYKTSGEDHLLSTILGTGDDIVTYFGKANWGSGEYAKGAFNDIEVYDFAPSINLGRLDNVRKDLELPTPTEEKDGYSITWASSNESVISSDGKVSCPAEGEENVTLTATIKFGSTTLTRSYEATVTGGLYVDITADSERNIISYDIDLPADIGECDTYTALYDGNGILQAVKKNSLKDSFSVNPERIYKLKVMCWKKDTVIPAVNSVEYTVSEYRLLSYVTNGTEYTGVAAPAIGNSLHLAVSDDGGKTYNPLNMGIGVLFAEADYTETVTGIPKIFIDPYLFRLKDGGWGVIAARADAANAADETDGTAVVYTSENLTDFELSGYLQLDTTAVSQLRCDYDGSVYKISWTNADGERKCGTAADFENISDTRISDSKYIRPESNIAIAKGTNSIAITKTEYEMLIASLNAPENIGVKKLDDITIPVNGTLTLPERVTALYNDGSVADYNVVWDAADFDSSSEGEYIISGTIQTKDYPSNMIPKRADPCMLNMDGTYYFVSTRDNGQQTVINIRTADSIEGIASAEDHEIYAVTADGDLVWAPEIHNVNGQLIILTAIGHRWYNVQSHVMMLKDNGNPLKASDWSEPVRIKKKDGTNYLIDNGITLDMTCFNYNDKWYYSWSHRVVSDIMGSADIYIAEFDPSDFTKVTSDIQSVSKPVYGWERTPTEVDEGPFAIKHNGRLYMTVATNGCNPTYAIKLLSLKENGDPLNPSDWTAKGYPLLATAWNAAEPGPGHSSFTTDENGDAVLIYHWGSKGTNRTTTAKRVHFNAKGEPVLNIPRGEQVKSEYLNVSVKVIVE